VQATGQTISLPAGQYSKLEVLAIGVDGNQPNQTFTVNYTTGSATTASQSISDWYTPQFYSGESEAISMSYRDTAGGGIDNRNFSVYSYTITLDNTRTLSSITLPNNGHVVILAMTTVQ